MRKNKGFTLIELMVVILIVAILAAVLAPMLSGRINESKWTEGKAGAGTIATALRAYVAEYDGLENDAGSTFSPGTPLSQLGFADGDLSGKYFSATSYAVTDVSIAADGAVYYTILVTPDDNKTGHPTGTKTLINDATNFSAWQ